MRDHEVMVPSKRSQCLDRRRHMLLLDLRAWHFSAPKQGIATQSNDEAHLTSRSWPPWPL
jgi:hypothetical protein